MARKKKRRKKQKTFRFQLNLTGIAGITVVCFCLFLWMFLLGIWAGQTILFPAAGAGRGKTFSHQRDSGHDNAPVRTLSPRGKKKSVAPATGRLETAPDRLLQVASLHEPLFYLISSHTHPPSRVLDQPV